MKYINCCSSENTRTSVLSRILIFTAFDMSAFLRRLTTISTLWDYFRLRNDLYCVEWGVKLYSLTHFGIIIIIIIVLLEMNLI